MTIDILCSFFMWCTIINSGFLLLWTAFFALSPDFIYNLQSKFIPLPREKYNSNIFLFVAIFKAIVIVFNLVPFLVLMILSCTN
jgi:hypothetical protein